MRKHQQFSKFERYVKDRERKITRTLSHIETRGAAAALDRCRVLADQINRDLRNKKLRHFFNNPSLLAEFQVSIERAASVLVASRLGKWTNMAASGATPPVQQVGRPKNPLVTRVRDETLEKRPHGYWPPSSALRQKTMTFRSTIAAAAMLTAHPASPFNVYSAEQN
jgi:hypothetical protein